MKKKSALDRYKERGGATKPKEPTSVAGHLNKSTNAYLDQLDSVEAVVQEIEDSYGIESPSAPSDNFRVISPKEANKLNPTTLSYEMSKCVQYIDYYTFQLNIAEAKLRAFKEREKILKKLLKAQAVEPDVHPRMLEFRMEHLRWITKRDSLDTAADAARKVYQLLSRIQSRNESAARKVGVR
jgi:hypothetical protein